ncbi:MAG TPA: glutamate--tRNA ligase family protein [Myxococcota bacterium]|nr:glutamate--tRNA ligase family protein [Myxococcota bacterium]
MSDERCRFAPTPSGPAHPGTLLAALLCWLDARSRGATILLRLEDVDATRCTAEKAEDMQAALRWLGLDWDEIALQSEHRSAHESALDALAERGALYPCSCSRSAIQRVAARAADGGWRYPGTCRGRALPRGGWRAARAALRLRLESQPLAPLDEGGSDLAQDPALAMGDPVLRSRDGSIAYHLAVVVDDAAARITRVVRGRDLVASTATQVALQRLLGLPTPRYRHHFLLVEERGGKLAKLHGAVGWRALRERYGPDALCGVLAACAGLLEEPRPARPAELVAEFDWSRVRADDLAVRWDGARLIVRA